MNNKYPRLINSKTKEITIVEKRILTIGNSKDSHLYLKKRKLPKIIGHIMFTNGNYIIHILSNDCKVSVNDKTIKSGSHIISHNDKISIDEFSFLFEEHSDNSIVKKSNATQNPLSDLISVVVSMLSNHDEDSANDLVASVSRLLSCDAARLVIEDDEYSKKLITIAVYPSGTENSRFSERAINWAKEANSTVLFNENDWQQSNESMNSLVMNMVASVLCAPLRDGDKILGYLYLDRLQKSNLFTNSDKELCDTLLPLFSHLLINSKEKQKQKEIISRLQKQNQESKNGIIYNSQSMIQTVTQAQKLAVTSSPVLILGETGTGKELMAKFLHENSPRSKNPYRAINCGAIPENLMESELFGHEKGAFTGASAKKQGLFEVANGGTILLDEIGELPLQLQVKLLRVLQESEILPVGATKPIPVDVRIIAATNRNPEDEVKNGKFRQDLYFRLNVLTIELPPLRERGQDALLLAEYFIKKSADQLGMNTPRLDAGARNAIISYNWPGNIRELENVMQRALVLGNGKVISKEDIHITSSTLLKTDSDTSNQVQTIKEARYEAESKVIKQTLDRTGGNISLSSRMLDIDRKWLMKKMNELNINADDYRK